MGMWRGSVPERPVAQSIVSNWSTRVREPDRGHSSTASDTTKRIRTRYADRCRARLTGRSDGELSNTKQLAQRFHATRAVRRITDLYCPISRLRIDVAIATPKDAYCDISAYPSNRRGRQALRPRVF